MKSILLPVFVFISAIGFSQIGGKFPSKNDIKNKVEKVKPDKASKTEVKDVSNDKKVETVTPAATTAESEVKAKEEKVSIPVVSPYPNVTEPTLLFAKDAAYLSPISEVVPGEGDVYVHFVLPGESVNDFLVNKLQITGGEIYSHLQLDFFDDQGNAVSLEGLMRDSDDRLKTFTINESKKMSAIVFPLLKANEGSLQTKFAERINENKLSYTTVPGMKSGVNKINVKFSLDNSTASSQQALSNPKNVLSTSFNINIKEENRTKIKRYKLDFRDLATIKDEEPAGIVHANNLDKIVFSKEPVYANSDEASKLTSNFKLTDDIFGGICLSKSYKNSLAEYGGSRSCTSTQEVRIFISIDGKEYLNLPIAESNFSCTATFSILALHDPKNITSNSDRVIRGGAKGLAYILSQTAPGKHTVKLEMRTTKSLWEQIGDGRALLLASGEFTLEYSAAELDAFVKANGQKFEFDGEETKDASIISLAKKGLPGAINYKIGDMIVQRNYYDKITHREGYMNAIVKNENGDYVLNTYKTTQQYVGGKWESKITVQYLNDYWYYVPVQNHK